MQQIVSTGRNIDDAINSALLQLGALREEVEVSPLDAGDTWIPGNFWPQERTC